MRYVKFFTIFLFHVLLTNFFLHGSAYSERGTLDKAETYNNQGLIFFKKGQLDEALGSFTLAIEIGPSFAEAYGNRAIAYFQKREYAGAWEDVYLAESLDFKFPPDFLRALSDASGREK